VLVDPLRHYSGGHSSDSATQSLYTLLAVLSAVANCLHTQTRLYNCRVSSAASAASAELPVEPFAPTTDTTEPSVPAEPHTPPPPPPYMSRWAKNLKPASPRRMRPPASEHKDRPPRFRRATPPEVRLTYAILCTQCCCSACVWLCKVWQ
jgi:hypothetical protein